MALGQITKWFLIFVFLTAATDVMGWNEDTLFLRKFVGYLPSPIIKVIIFSLLATLIQLKVGPTLPQTLFTGIIARLAIAGNLAFGLGGKGQARQLIENIKKTRILINK